MNGGSVLITGANRGLGLEFVKQFIALPKPPKRIFAVCRSPAEATELKKLSASNPTIHILGLEVTEPSQYDKTIGEVRKVVGTSGLNLLINNAGMFEKDLSTMDHQTKENLLAHYELNLVAPVLLMKAFAPLLKEAAVVGKGDLRSSVVLNITALLASFKYENLFPGGYPYKYSKIALNMATHCLGEELKPSGVFVTGLHPGWVRTDMGGPQGHLSVEESVSGMMNVLANLEEKHRGKMFDWKNEEIPMT